MARSRIARLNANGTVDPTFNATIAEPVSLVLPLPGGKTLICSDRLTRLNADGSIDVVLGVEAGGSATIYALAVQPDGSLLVGGGFTSINGIARRNLARFLPDGSLDPSFDPSAAIRHDVTLLALQPDGRILFDERDQNGESPRLLRLNANGTVDLSFAPGDPRPATTFAAARQSDGRYVVAGPFTQVGDAARPGVARLQTNGAADPAFNPPVGPNAPSQTVAVQTDGRIVVAGAFTAVGAAPRPGLARFLPDGSLDFSFNPSLNAGATIRALAALPDGRVVVGGRIASVDALPRGNLAAFLPSGASDPTFAATFNGDVTAIVPRPGGGVFVAGEFSIVDGQRRNRLAALTASGAVDLSFDPAQLTSADAIQQLVALPEGGVVIATLRPQVGTFSARSCAG